MALSKVQACEFGVATRSSGQAISATMPSGAPTNGNLLIASCIVASTTPPTVGAGWTLLPSLIGATASMIGAWKVAASETTTTSPLVAAASGTPEYFCVMIEITGFVDVVPSANSIQVAAASAGSATLTLPSLTSLGEVAGAYYSLNMEQTSANGVTTAPSGFTVSQNSASTGFAWWLGSETGISPLAVITPSIVWTGAAASLGYGILIMPGGGATPDPNMIGGMTEFCGGLTT